MEPKRFLECLAHDAARLRDLAARDLGRRVPSCPEWTAGDLVRHVAHVYLHKVESMRRGEPPKPWPPPELESEEPIALFDRGLTELMSEFARRDPSDATVTWYPPEQNVRFWIRRMAQETVIHRVDAELAADEPHQVIADDLAIDGVDEVLVCMLSYISKSWPDEFKPVLGDAGGESVAIRTGDRAWIARLEPNGVHLTDGDASATVSGAPDDVLLWLWRRAGDDVVKFDGDTASITKMRDALGIATI